MDKQDIYDIMVLMIPKHFSLETVELVMTEMKYFPTLLNTLFFSLLIAVIQTAMSLFVGYGFARFDFPLKKFWFACVIMVIIIPPQTISTSLHLHFRYFDVFGLSKMLTGETINLRGSILPYYLMSAGCMGLKNGLYIYMIRQFF